MPAQIPGIGEDVSHLMDAPGVGEDVSHLMGGNAVSAEDFTPKAPEGSAVGRFLSNAGEALNPITALEGVASAVAHPIDTAKGIIGSQVGEAEKALDLIKQGRYTEAAGHGAAALLPILGPAAAKAGEQIASGDIAGGFGKTAGLVAPMAAGAVVPSEVKVPGPLAPAGQGVADAAALAESNGVPLDVATASGNRFARAAQHLSDRTLGGGMVADKALEAQKAGLATLGEQLAAKGYSAPVSAEAAGEAVRSGVLGQVNANADLANTAYSELRKIEADPANLREITPEAAAPNPDAPMRFSFKPRPTQDDVFSGVLKDAKANGYRGTVEDLRDAFDQRVASAKDLKASSAEGAEYSPSELLSSIRELGGIRSFDKDLQPGTTATKLSGEYDNLKSLYRNRGVFTEGGKPIDQIVDELRQDPRWKTVLTDNPEDLKSVLEEIHSSPEKGPTDLEHYLRGAGVQPGTQWWQQGAKPMQVALPVDLRPAQQALKPLYDELSRQRDLAPASIIGDKATALQALDKIVNGPTHASLSTVDAVLSDLKRFARGGKAGEVPALATPGQAAAKQAITNLDGLVQRTAAEAGPDAIDALKMGRSATVAKYQAADVLDGLNAEPARTLKSLIGDGNLAKLRSVADQAPDVLPQVGRAHLDNLLAMEPDKAFAEWKKTGTATKQILYQDPGYVKDLSDFFNLRKMAGSNPNPSGTAHTVATMGQAGLMVSAPWIGVPLQVGTAALSKLLHSDAGVRLLTRGLKIPIGNKAAGAAWVADLSAATNPSGSQTQTTAPGQPALAAR
jgi:hypothetical protein